MRTQKQNILFTIAALLILFSAGNLLRHCRSRSPLSVKTANRMVHCVSCGETFPLPPGYITTLAPKDIRIDEVGRRYMKCPRCNELGIGPPLQTIHGDESR